jgi:hypothetical protein
MSLLIRIRTLTADLQISATVALRLPFRPD